MTLDPKFSGWALDPQIMADTTAVGDLPLCRVLLMNDANYPWLLLVPRRQGAVEIVDLTADEQTQLMNEIAKSARGLKAITGCNKINVAALGNVVAQLHIHVIARFHNDAAWPKPVWGVAPAQNYQADAKENLLTTLRRQLPLSPC